jgi:L-asparaginase/Glu-tRNA(Gln) amidotransferase subunit D
MISTSELNDTALAISTIWRLATLSLPILMVGSMSMSSRVNSSSVIRYISP